MGIVDICRLLTKNKSTEEIFCSDKKVSRNHGKIQLTADGNVLLVALHSNPCFFMKNGLPPVLQLAKHQEQLLKNGDYFGLLPDSFWYKIVVENKDPCSSAGCLLNFSNNVGNESESFNQGMSGKFDGTEATETSEEQRNLNDSYEKSKSVELSERWKALEKTRKLPISMYQIDDFQGKIEQGSLDGELNCSSESNKPHITESAKHFEKDLPAATSSAYNHLNEKHCAPILHSPEIIHGKQTKINEDNVQIHELDLENVAHINNASVKVKVDDAEHVPKVSNLNSGYSHKRPLCQYEGRCFRKNEVHRGEFCHPGDPDFIPYEKRPKCQYGASCYRRNKTHHIQYQHPELAKPKGKAPEDSPKRKRQKKGESSYRGSFDEDDYDLEDPFINDGSSDEYIPSDFGESDDEMDDLTPENASVADS